MVDRLVREIDKCLNNGCCMAALSLALMLPDICGKAMFPDMRNNKDRYVRWYDEYGVNEIKNNPLIYNLPIEYLTGNVLYLLRCSMLHQGNPNLEKGKEDFVYFELLYREIEGASSICDCIEAQIVKDENGDEKAINKRFSINIRELCFKIGKLAEIYYKNNKEKFNFFNYNLVDTDFHTKETMFGARYRSMKKEIFQHKTFEERIKEFDGKAGEVQNYDWGEPVGKEIL